MNISLGAPHVLGIEINEYCTRVVEMNYKSGTPKIYRMFEFDTPEGMLEDGQVVESGAFAGRLSEECIRHEIHTNRVVFSIMSSQILEKEAVVPAMKGSRLKEMLRLNASDYFPINVSEYVLAYEIIEKIEEVKNRKQYKLSIKAIPQELLKSYHQLAASCGMQLIQIDYGMNGMFQMIRAMQEGHSIHVFPDSLTLPRKKQEQDTALKLYILPAEEHTKLMLVQNDKVMLQRILPETMEEEEELSRTVLRVLEFYLNRQGALEGQLQVTLLGVSEYEYLMTVLRDRLGAEVHTFHVSNEKSFFSNRIFSDEEIGLYAPAIGSCIHPLGLRMKGEVGSGEDFSLLEFVLSDSVQTSVAVILMMFGVVFGMRGAFYLAAGLYDYHPYRKAIEDQKSQIAELTELKEVKEDYDSTYEEYKNMLEVSEYMKTANDSVVDFIEELEDVLPSDAEVKEISFSVSGAAVQVEMTSWKSIAYTIMQFRKMETAELIEDSLPTTYVDIGTAAGYGTKAEDQNVQTTDYTKWLDVQLRQECLTRMKKYPALVNMVMAQNGASYTEEELTDMINSTNRSNLILALQQSDVYIASLNGSQNEGEELPEHLYQLTAQFSYKFDVLPILQNLQTGIGQTDGIFDEETQAAEEGSEEAENIEATDNLDEMDEEEEAEPSDEQKKETETPSAGEETAS